MLVALATLITPGTVIALGAAVTPVAGVALLPVLPMVPVITPAAVATLVTLAALALPATVTAAEAAPSGAPLLLAWIAVAIPVGPLTVAVPLPATGPCTGRAIPVVSPVPPSAGPAVTAARIGVAPLPPVVATETLAPEPVIGETLIPEPPAAGAGPLIPTVNAAMVTLRPPVAPVRLSPSAPVRLPVSPVRCTVTRPSVIFTLVATARMSASAAGATRPTRTVIPPTRPIPALRS